MSKNVVIAVVVILVLVVAGWYFTRPKQTTPIPTPTQAPTSTESATPAAASSGAVMKEENMVKISSNGFSPQSMTVKVGTTVTWTNEDSANHTVNSDNHPTHTLYPFLNLGLIKPGDKKSATFEKSGTYTYHDHLNPSLTGSVTVQ